MVDKTTGASPTNAVEQTLDEILCLAQVTRLNGNLHKLEGLVTAARFLANALGSACTESALKRLIELEAVLYQQDKDSGWVI